MKAFLSLLVAASLFGFAPAQAVDVAPPVDSHEGPPISFFVILTPDDESTPTESTGTGRIDFTLDRKTQKISWKGSFQNLPPNSRPTGIYVHGPQTIGGEAGILFDLSPGGMKNPFEGSYTLNDGQVEYLVTGRFYVNLHTTKYPGGELRGEVRRLPPKDAGVTQ